jgi:two-component system NarL family response regulator
VNVVVVHAEPVVSAGIAAVLRQVMALTVSVEPVDWWAANGPSAPASDWPLADVVACDYQTGIECVHRYRRFGHRVPAPAVLLVTHCDSEGDVRRALDLGVSGYLVLGDPLDELVHAVTSLAEGKRYVSHAVAGRIVDSLSGPALTQRELEVVRLVGQGASNKAIALRLEITVGTVKAHMRTVLDKLGAVNRMEAAAVAQRRGLLHFHAPAGRPAKAEPVSW